MLQCIQNAQFTGLSWEDYKDEMSIHPISSDKIDLRWGPS